MPYINVKVAGRPLEPRDVEALAAGVTGLMESVLGKRRALTSVLVEQAGASGWSVGGRIAGAESARAHVEASITAGTNTEAEKARFVAEAAALLGRVLPGLPQATYVVVREVPATDWGYDGRTQLSRRAAQGA
ncbi:MAG: tautomerase family protein [Pseudomonadota bacterium]